MDVAEVSLIGSWGSDSTDPRRPSVLWPRFASYTHWHPERNVSRILRQTESKDVLSGTLLIP